VEGVPSAPFREREVFEGLSVREATEEFLRVREEGKGWKA
jgi:hypothetical protein